MKAITKTGQNINIKIIDPPPMFLIWDFPGGEVSSNYKLITIDTEKKEAIYTFLSWNYSKVQRIK